MQLEPRMTEFNVLISWVGNSVQNIFLHAYSEPGTIRGPQRNKDRYTVPELEELPVLGDML